MKIEWWKEVVTSKYISWEIDFNENTFVKDIDKFLSIRSDSKSMISKETNITFYLEGTLFSIYPQWSYKDYKNSFFDLYIDNNFYEEVPKILEKYGYKYKWLNTEVDFFFEETRGEIKRLDYIIIKGDVLGKILLLLINEFKKYVRNN